MSVSIICACKNRRKALSISLSSWIQFDEVDEIIVTDWNSDDSIDHLVQLSRKIKIINVRNEPYFNQPQPLNLAASLVKSEYLLKLDCDHILNPYFNFFDLHKIDKNSFISGCSDVNWGMDAYFLYPLWGLLYVKNEIFKKVGGYNENMGKYYAVEDDELSVRLISYGLDPISIDIQKFSALHIPHTDKDRVKNFESFESINKLLSESKKDLQKEKLYRHIVKLSRNKNHNEYPIVSRMLDMFNKEFNDKIDINWYSEPIYKWEMTQLKDQIYEAVKI
jgi:GT2 family glycosyltransferase